MIKTNDENWKEKETDKEEAQEKADMVKVGSWESKEAAYEFQGSSKGLKRKLMCCKSENMLHLFQINIPLLCSI